MSVSSTPPFKAQFLMPQYWAIWLGVLLLWSLAHLPWRAQFRLGNWLGEVLWRLAKRRQHDTLINLALCFPELSEAERIEMSIDVFRNGMLGFFESLSSWYTPKRFNDKVTITGLEHLV
ncbi:MAG TPA: lipid A biosynthesis acyltransferase, partial [Aquirhabdus sp.]